MSLVFSIIVTEKRPKENLLQLPHPSVLSTRENRSKSMFHSTWIWFQVNSGSIVVNMASGKKGISVAYLRNWPKILEKQGRGGIWEEPERGFPLRYGTVAIMERWGWWDWLGYWGDRNISGAHRQEIAGCFSGFECSYGIALLLLLPFRL